MSLKPTQDFGSLKMEIPKPNRKYKDKLFHKIFSEKDAMLDLYRTLHPEDTVTGIDDLCEITLDNALVNDYYNDLGFRVGNRLIVLVEEQATVCPNMPMRMLIYITHEYEQYIKNHGIHLHGILQEEFPTPEFYVVSTCGEQGKELLLSNAFVFDKGMLQLRVKVIQKDEMRADTSLNSYQEFIEMVKHFKKETGSLRTALEIGISKLQGNNPAVRIIKREGANMFSLLEERLTEEDYKRELEESVEIAKKRIGEKAREEGLAEGREKGLVEGREKGLAEGRAEGRTEGRDAVLEHMIKVKIKAGFSKEAVKEELISFCGLTESESERLLKKVL